MFAINRPGIVRAVPQTHLLGNSSFVKISSKYLHTQTIRARDRSCVICHASRVTCDMSPVTCHMSHVKSFFFLLLLLLSFLLTKWEASRWRVCYQWGLPHLVSLYSLGFLDHLHFCCFAENYHML